MLAWKKAIKAKSKQNDEVKQLHAPVKNYVVPSGWVKTMARESPRIEYYGFRHHYIGVALNSHDHDELLASRDVVLSYIFGVGAAKMYNPSSTTPSSVWFIKEMMMDIGGWKTQVNTAGETYSIIRLGLSVIIDVMSTELTANQIRVNISDLNFRAPLKQLAVNMNDGQIISTMESVRAGTVNELSHEAIDHFILYCSLAMFRVVGYEIEIALLHFLISFSKMGNTNDITVTRRINSFKQNNILDEGFFDEDLKADDYLELYRIVQYHIEKGTTTPELITSNIIKLISTVKNVALKPLINYIAYTGMSAITNITTAISSFPQFPWNGLIKKNPKIQAEFQIYYSIIKECSKDLYLGYKVGGAATAVPTLAYICTQLLIEVGGIDTLKDYHGTGSKRTSKVINKQYFDTLIESFRLDLVKQAGDFNDLQELEKSLVDIIGESGLSHLMAKYTTGSDLLKGEDIEETDDDDLPEFDPPYRPDSDDDDDNNHGPFPPSSKPRKRDEKSSRPDKRDTKKKRRRSDTSPDDDKRDGYQIKTPRITSDSVSIPMDIQPGPSQAALPELPPIDLEFDRESIKPSTGESSNEHDTAALPPPDISPNSKPTPVLKKSLPTLMTALGTDSMIREIVILKKTFILKNPMTPYQVQDYLTSLFMSDGTTLSRTETDLRSALHSLGDVNKVECRYVVNK